MPTNIRNLNKPWVCTNKPSKSTLMSHCTITIRLPCTSNSSNSKVPLVKSSSHNNSSLMEKWRTLSKRQKSWPERLRFLLIKVNLKNRSEFTNKVWLKIRAKKLKTNCLKSESKRSKVMTRRISIQNSLKNTVRQEMHFSRKVKFYFRKIPSSLGWISRDHQKKSRSGKILQQRENSLHQVDGISKSQRLFWEGIDKGLKIHQGHC